MQDKKITVGLYPRVSTEDQSRFGHSLDEQKDRLLKICEYKNYEVYKIYEEAGVSAKNMERPKFQEMINDVKLGKINKIIVYKLDRLTRSIKDLESICVMLEEHNCSLESVVEEINTDTAMGKFFIRFLTIIAQLEIEQTSERTKFGLVGAAKKGHFVGQAPLGYDKKDKKLVVNELESEVVKRIFDLYTNGKSVMSICKLFNKEKVLNRKWATTTVDRMLSNYIYIGAFEHCKSKKDRETQIFNDVCPAIIDKKVFNIVQAQKEKNKKNYVRKRTYMFMQSIICPNCGKIMGGCSSTSHTGDKHCYYQCASCKLRISEKKIEEPLLNFLNDMLDYFLLIDNTFKPFLNSDTSSELNRYTKMLNVLETKEKRIKKAYVDGIVESDVLKDELDLIVRQKQEINIKIMELEKVNESLYNKDKIRLIYNLKQLEKLKLKSYYAKNHNLWNELSKEQKQNLITKYISTIEVKIYKDSNLIIKNININNQELENIGYMFLNECFDMLININEQDIILSNKKTTEDIQEYIKSLSNYYNVKQTIIDKEKFDLNMYNQNETLQIVPIKKNKRFEKEQYTLLEIKA